MDSLVDDLNPAQREAVLHENGPLLVVAGPGSGKTRVVSRRVAHLLRTGVKPWEILAVTFTNRAARELKERVHALSPAEGLWVGTFHATCARILREQCEAIGYPRSFTILDEEDRSRLVGRALRHLQVDKDTLSRSNAVHAISDRKGKGESPEDLARKAYAPNEEILAQVWRLYEGYLRDQRAMDFDDLLQRVRDLFDVKPDILAHYALRFRHVLVDEYQDTNAVQFSLARDLASHSRNLCATGDPDQSIYAWRGADIRNILDFQQHFPEAKVVRLETNYRSMKSVLEAADRLISRNKSRIHKILRSTKAQGEAVRILRLPDADTEGEAVAASVAEWIRSGRPPSDCAVLYRVNSRSRAVESGLRRRGIPYRVVRGVEFFQRAEVKDLVAWLRLMVNPRDGEALLRVASAFAEGLGETSMQRIEAEAAATGRTPLELLLSGRFPATIRGRASTAAVAFSRLIRVALDAPDGRVEDVLRRLITMLDVEDRLRRRFPEEFEERMENVNELVVAAAAYDTRDTEGRRLEGFVEQVALVSDQDRLDEDTPRVSLLSLHSCKGLEFPWVWIVGVEAGVLPHMRAADNEAGREEERRLLFVGMTRARERLTLSCALRAVVWSGGASGPSEFLDELHGPGVVVEGAAPRPAWEFDDAPSRPRGGAAPARPGMATRAPWGGGFRRPAGPTERDASFEPSFDVTPDEPVAEVRGLGFRVGDRVRHATFGVGKVRHLESRGSAVRVTVEFRMGVKVLDSTMARLEREGGSP